MIDVRSHELLTSIVALLERQAAKLDELAALLRRQVDQNDRAAAMLRDEFHANRKLGRELVVVVQDLRGELEHERTRPERDARIGELAQTLSP